MQAIINLLLALVFLLLGLEKPHDFEPIEDEYLSPEFMYLDNDNRQIFIGLATYPGIAVYNTDSNNISQIISMPGPVQGVIIDHEKNVLYAAAGDQTPYLYAYDLESKKLQKPIKTGHGPTDLVLSKNADLLFVTNRFSNDISVIDSKSQKEIKKIDAGREPVAIDLSPEGNLLAVANLLPSQASTENYISAKITLIDVNRLEVDQHIGLPNGSYRLKDILFSLDGKFIYVSHLIGRYNVLTNQIEKGWINTNALSIIDASSKEHLTTVLLDDIHKGAANPYGLNLSDDGKSMLVAISGTDELFVIDREAMHGKIEQSKKQQTNSQSTNLVSKSDDKIALFEHPDQYKSMTTLFEDIPNELGFLSPVRKRIQLHGRCPSQIVSENSKIYISSYFSDGIDIVDLDNGICEDFMDIGIKDVTLSAERYGELLFHSAGNCFQQWQSCASCHPGGGRVDGLNWDLMNDGIGNPKNTKNLLFSHETPPAMATGIRADAETGVRAGFKFIQFFDVSEEDAQAVDAYLKSLKPIPSPHLMDGKLSKSAKRGKALFEASGCANCHSGEYYTNRKQYEMGEIGKYDKQNLWDTPTLVEIWRTAPYLHDGKYSDLEDVFKIGKHGIEEDLSGEEINDLTTYLLSL